MALMDHSQSGEQAMILEWADRRSTKGRFLDIGSTDGIAASNVRALALRGWSGVCIEPAAWAFDKLADLYADVPEIETVQAAIVAEPSPLVRFHYAHDLLSTIRGCLPRQVEGGRRPVHSCSTLPLSQPSSCWPFCRDLTTWSQST